MLGFVQTWFAPSANPIGIDLGTDYLRMAQVEPAGEKASASDFRLIAAASVEIPAAARVEPADRIAFFGKSVRELLARGNFRGRRAVLALPACAMHVVQLTVPTSSTPEAPDSEMARRELAACLPMDPATAVLRHLVIGQIKPDGPDGGVFDRIVAFAADRSFIEQYLSASAKARLDVVGLNLEPKAIVDCFSHVYRRKSDRDVASCYVDIGSTATRVAIARGEQILFARIIDIGGDTFTGSVAEAMHISIPDARLLRIKHCPGQVGEIQNAQTSLHSVPAEHPQSTNPRERQAIEQACQLPLQQLIAAIGGCAKDHESAMPQWPVNRLIFIGGEARQRGLCQQIARVLNLPAQLGDPLVRMGRISEVGVESGIDRRQPQPAWSVAIGLSMGPARTEQTMESDTPARPAMEIAR